VLVVLFCLLEIRMLLDTHTLSVEARDGELRGCPFPCTSLLCVTRTLVAAHHKPGSHSCQGMDGAASLHAPTIFYYCAVHVLTYLLFCLLCSIQTKQKSMVCSNWMPSLWPVASHFSSEHAPLYFLSLVLFCIYRFRFAFPACHVSAGMDM
jgi:hypothetical protein